MQSSVIERSRSAYAALGNGYRYAFPLLPTEVRAGADLRLASTEPQPIFVPGWRP